MTTKLFVANLDWHVEEADLYDVFLQAGPVVSVKIPTERDTGRKRGFAFVEMATPGDAQNAVSLLNGRMVNNREIVVTFQDESRSGGSSRRESGNGQEAPPSTKLFIRNVSAQTSEAQLGRLFEQAGQVAYVKIPIDKMTGEQKPFAFVEMASLDEARQAVAQLNEQMLDGQAIRVSFQDPNRQTKARPQRGGGFDHRRADQASGYGYRY